MPAVSTLPIAEARARSATSKRAALLQEYFGYLERVEPGEAGKLSPERARRRSGGNSGWASRWHPLCFCTSWRTWVMQSVESCAGRSRAPWRYPLGTGRNCGCSRTRSSSPG